MTAATLLLATCLVLAGLAAAGLGLRVRRFRAELAGARERVRSQAAEIEAMFAGMIDGILVVSGDMRVIRWNARFPDITGVPAEKLRPGLTLADILRLQAEVGEFGAVDVETEVVRRMGLVNTGDSFGVIERIRPNGRVMELRRSHLADGGFVTVYTDITRRRRAEEAVAPGAEDGGGRPAHQRHRA